jgi:hypothetical protein
MAVDHGSLGAFLGGAIEMASLYEAWLAAMAAAAGVRMIIEANSAPGQLPGLLLLAAAGYLLRTKECDNDNHESKK